MGLGEAQVAGHGHRPGRADELVRRPEEAGGQLSGAGSPGPDEAASARGPTAGGQAAVGQGLTERQRLQGGNGHALGIDRVEAAQGVTHDEQPGWHPVEPLVVPPDAGREPHLGRVVQRLGLPHHGGYLGPAEAVGIGQHVQVAGRRVLPEHAREREYPLVALLADERGAAPLPRVGHDRGADDPAQLAGVAPVVSRDVDEVDPQSRLDRLRVAEVGQPGWRPRPPPGRVHYQVGRDYVGRARAGPGRGAGAGNSPQADPGDPLLLDDQAVHRARGVDRDVRKLLDPGPDHPLKSWPGHADPVKTRGRLPGPVPVQVPVDVGEHVPVHATGREHLAAEAGQQLVKRADPTGVQAVGLSALRHSRPGR
ncbi:MAG TPA: hypothetical protein VMU95_01015 [Trebonia sp.]|nr:hypothetical protein [Trebonia sp.]